MKKTFLLLSSFLTFFVGFAQHPVSSTDNPSVPNSVLSIIFALNDNGFVSGFSRAPQGSSRYERTHYLITASELAAAGIPNGVVFNALGFNYYTAQNIATTGNFMIYLENTSDVNNNKSATWTTAISTMTLVHNNPITIPASTGVFDIPFVNGSSFTYTGGGLYVAWDYQNAADPIATTGNNAFVNTTLVNGLKGSSSTTAYAALTNSSNRPATRLGWPLVNDAAVTQVYTLGKLPIPYGSPHTIKTNIKNNGDNTLTNVQVTLNITGTNTFTDVQTIPSLASQASVDVSFAAFTPANIGANTIVVSVPADNVNTNNSVTVSQTITNNSYSYAYGTTPSGGVGFNGATGDFVAKFNSNSPTTINQVSVNFSAGGQPFQVGIWDATGAGGTPGTNLWTSSGQTSTSGVFTLPVSPAIPVNGDFYVGVRQTGTVNVSFSYQTENPIRPQTFYYTSPSGGTTWTDFAPNSSFRFMIEPRLTLANDVGPSIINEPTTGANSICTTPIAPKAIISNYGTINQTFNVNFMINQGVNTVYNNTQNVSIAAGSSQTVTFANTFVPVSGGAYSSTVTTSLTGDGDVTNDIITNNFNYTQYNYGGGGPNSGGYYFANSTPCAAQAPSQPTYNWMTVTTNQIDWGPNGDDSVAAPIPLPFPFIYFGNVYTQTWVGSNGWISFTNPTALTPVQQRTPLIIPSPGALENYIAGLMMDLDLTPADYPLAHVYYGMINNRFVITFDHAYQWSGTPATNTDFITFQIIIDIANTITIQYNDGSSTNPFPNSMRDGAVIGIENSNGTAGIMYRGGSVGGPIFGSPLAVKFSQNAATLPVTIASFTAQRNGSVNELHWTINQELNLSHYIVERSTDGVNFTSIGQVTARGFTSSAVNYQFVDHSPVKGINYYRLRIVDINNPVKYSEVRTVKIAGITDITIAPNPVTGIAHVQVDAEKADAGSIEVLDLNGKKLSEQFITVKQGLNAFDLNMSSLAKGIYMIRVNFSETSIVKKINKL